MTESICITTSSNRVYFQIEMGGYDAPTGTVAVFLPSRESIILPLAKLPDVSCCALEASASNLTLVYTGISFDDLQLWNTLDALLAVCLNHIYMSLAM